MRCLRNRVVSRHRTAKIPSLGRLEIRSPPHRKRVGIHYVYGSSRDVRHRRMVDYRRKIRWNSGPSRRLKIQVSRHRVQPWIPCSSSCERCHSSCRVIRPGRTEALLMQRRSRRLLQRHRVQSSRWSPHPRLPQKSFLGQARRTPPHQATEPDKDVEMLPIRETIARFRRLSQAPVPRSRAVRENRLPRQIRQPRDSSHAVPHPRRKLRKLPFPWSSF